MKPFSAILSAIVFLSVCLNFALIDFAYTNKKNYEIEVKELQLEIKHLKEIDLRLQQVIDNLIVKQHFLDINVTKIYNNMLNKNYTYASYVYKASKLNSLDPLLLTSLINSESSFLPSVKHSLPHVKGLAGINHKYWNIPNDTVEEQIHAGAIVLKHYLDRYNNDYLKTLIAYKGISNLGRKQALLVYSNYKKMKNS
ncbi:transglycosylase SLT domain-containing protein [Campylobacter hyointestinalis]|uniref:transglycosylase SLT domain-containing protein n=1 Tax=Campylobacter hyointestinalis TaxID=198 RepID=UPI000723A838|nr:transglycosylase SLT domain-containing protein [Campylobacter hyointestinalis]CUU91942.1 Uncharacterised protein [Campylobacter hyointestinalis subsp. hyointestinalis]